MSIARPEFHLAQVNIGILRAPLESPEIADFVALLDPINALADGSPGFVWRLTGEGGNATDVKAFGDQGIIINMSVWRSLDELRDFVYRSDHVHVSAPPAGVVREAGRGLPGAVVAARRPPADGRRGRVADRSHAPPRPDGGGVHVPIALRATGGVAASRSRDRRGVLLGGLR